MFLQPNYNTNVSDLNSLDESKLTARFRYLRKLLDDIRHRFRSEYLGFLTQKKSLSNYELKTQLPQSSLSKVVKHTNVTTVPSPSPPKTTCSGRLVKLPSRFL
ncbi:hypothetical protein ACJJTC_019126 [Scirpophaga incertulas]